MLLVIYALTTAVSFTIESPVPSSAPPLNGKQQLGVHLDIWVMPVVMLFVLYWTSKHLSGVASLTNMLWVMSWSQLPVIVLNLISIPMELSGMQIYEPLFSNKLIIENGLPLFEPAVLQLNSDAVVYFVISTALLLWSFQILLSGVAAVSGVTMKRALWILTVAVIALMLIRLPITIILGDRDLMDVLGLKGILEP